MALSEEEIIGAADMLRGVQDTERFQLDILRRYYTGRQSLPLVIPSDAPREIREMARTARINLIRIVVESLVQSLYVDDLKAVSDPATVDGSVPDPAAADDITLPAWTAWQANKLDARQSGLYRGVFEYGWGYGVVLPGDPLPVMRFVSARKMTALYADDGDDWPELALERRRQPGTYRLYFRSGVAELGYNPDKKGFGILRVMDVPLDYVPVIRYVNVEDLDADDEPEPHNLTGAGRDAGECLAVAGEVAPLMALQDQADISSFALKAAEWYTGFRQRWIVGWTPGSKAEKMKSAASQMWTFNDHPDDVRVGEFSETTLDGFLKSREALLKYGATLSQTPVHELVGELINLSAEALAAAEAGRDRKVSERKTALGESHEQMFGVVGDLTGSPIPDDAEVVWRDTSARAFAAIVDGLGKIAQMLQVPPEELWGMIPGVTRQQIRAWKARRAEGDALSSLTSLLDRQASAVPVSPIASETTSPGGVILPRGVTA